MKFKFNQVFKVFVLFCFLFSLSLPISSQSAAVQVRSLTGAMYQFAKGELPRILEKIPVDLEERYGFNNRDEFKRAGLGIPYQEFSLGEETATGYWRVPVTVDGENRALLRLKEVDGQWTFFGFGAARLSRELGFFENNMAESKPTWGRIVRDFRMQCDYVQFEPENLYKLEGSLHPMESAAKFLLRTFPNIDSSGYSVLKIKEIRASFLKSVADAGGKTSGKTK
jgi:hypothetical protein